MATVLVLGDIHLKLTQVDTILSWEEPYDRVISLGDVLDSRGFTGFTTNLAGARWWRAKLDDPRWVSLLGNHDIGLRWPDNPHVYTNDWGSYAARDLAVALFDEAAWSKVKPYHTEAGILFTHAGLSSDLFPALARAGWETPEMDAEGRYTLEAITTWLNAIWPAVVERFKAGGTHPLLGAGRDRGGDNPVGGLVWCDFDYHSPIDGLGQVIGHSVVEEPLLRFINRNGAPMWRPSSRGTPEVAWFKEGWTLDLDTRLRHYAVLDTVTRTLTIKGVTWIRESRESDTYRVEPGAVVTTIQLPPLT